MNYVLRIYLPALIAGPFALYHTITTGLWPGVILLWALISGLGIAVGFHRVYSHRTHKLKPWLDAIVLLFGTLGGQGSSISWTAVHRGYHHPHSDTARDLHSPSKGFWSAFIGWYWNLTPDTINHKYAVDLLRKPLHVLLHKHYINFLWTVVLALGLTDFFLGTSTLPLYLSALFISLLQDNLVNTLCHQPYLGYRNWRLKDNSNNFWPLGYFAWGQGWHENHHESPARFNFGRRWWELDPSLLFLPLLKVGSYRDAR